MVTVYSNLLYHTNFKDVILKKFLPADLKLEVYVLVGLQKSLSLTDLAHIRVLPPAAFPLLLYPHPAQGTFKISAQGHPDTSQQSARLHGTKTMSLSCVSPAKGFGARWLSAAESTAVPRLGCREHWSCLPAASRTIGTRAGSPALWELRVTYRPPRTQAKRRTDRASGLALSSDAFWGDAHEQALGEG